MAYPDKHFFLIYVFAVQLHLAPGFGWVQIFSLFRRWILSACLLNLGPEAEGTTSVWPELFSCSREQEQEGRWKVLMPLNTAHVTSAHILSTSHVLGHSQCDWEVYSFSWKGGR